jgi:hypothetical protein
MAAIIEPLRPARVLAQPKKFAPLRGFSCGRKGTPWEKMVNEWSRDLYLGIQAHPQTVLVLEDAVGKLIGVCSFNPDPVPVRAGKLMGEAQRIHMLGTDRLYHGMKLQDGSRPGDVLLRGVLEHIGRVCDGHMPYVWALVTPENDRSHALFDRHGFDRWPYAGEGEVIRIRDPKKSLSGSASQPLVSRMIRWFARRDSRR